MFALGVILLTQGCRKDALPVYTATPYTMDYPSWVKPPHIPGDNPLTVEGVELGRRLFYDKILSRNNTQSCSDCHAQEFGFTDHQKPNSKGIDGISGIRNSMALFNLAWTQPYTWSGGATNLESQAMIPITSEIEMHENFSTLIPKLQNSSIYPKLFERAFGTDSITTQLLLRAIAQFERSIVSFNSPFDRKYQGDFNKITEAMKLQRTPEERGLYLFFNSSEVADCWHCHVTTQNPFDNPLFGDAFVFRNNGLDAVAADSGRYLVSGRASDIGRFKVPTLRNLLFTAPYMHDGRFKTLDEVIDHYNDGGVYSPTVDPNMRHVGKGMNLTDEDKQALKAFLISLTDSSLLTNPRYKSPF